MVIVNQLIFATTLSALSAMITWLMLRVRILDVPNQRSSHERPIPNSGGLSIVLIAYGGAWAAYMWLEMPQIADKKILGLGLAASILVLVGILDDLKFLRSFKPKLVAQFIACCLLLYFGIWIENFHMPFIGKIDLGLWAYPMTIIWVLVLTNIYNFMDGLDGLAAGTALLVAACFGLIALSAGMALFAQICIVLFSATAGFFVFNFPRARIFMGDVGSQFLGFVFSALAVLVSQYEPSGTVVYVVPLLFFHFIFDGVFTFIRRLLAGENVTRAHKKHLYQLLNQIGYSHPQVSLLHFGMVLLQGAGAAIMMRGTISEPGWVLLPYILLQSIYAGFVVRTARRHGLVG